MKTRRDWLAGAAALPGFALLAADPKLANAVMDPAQARVTQESFGELRVYFEGATAQLKSMTAGSLRLKPGMSPHPPHQHEEEEFMLVTEGTGEIVVEGKTQKVGPGSMMYCAGGKQHGIRNTGSKALLFYYYKWQA